MAKHAREIEGDLLRRVACYPGGKTRSSIPIIVVPLRAGTASSCHGTQVANESFESSSAALNNDEERHCQSLDRVLQYLLHIATASGASKGVMVLLDARQGCWRLMKAAAEQAQVTLGSHLVGLWALKPEPFWEKQHVDCMKGRQECKVQYLSIAKLHKMVDLDQLPEELGGTLPYQHKQWVKNRIRLEKFLQDSQSVLAGLEEVRSKLEHGCLVQKSEGGFRMVEWMVSTGSLYKNRLHSVRKFEQMGRKLHKQLETDDESGFRLARPDGTVADCTAETQRQVQEILFQIRGKVGEAEQLYEELQCGIQHAREVRFLETGVESVTGWVLGPGADLLRQLVLRGIGSDPGSVISLQQDLEHLELKCRDTYAKYAEVRHRLGFLFRSRCVLPSDLRSRRSFMDSVCRTFAGLLERRRRVLITSLRFHRLLTEFHGKLADALQAVQNSGVGEDPAKAEAAMNMLDEFQQSIDALCAEVESEAQRLLDLLVLPPRDAVGRELQGYDHRRERQHVQFLLRRVQDGQGRLQHAWSMERLRLRRIIEISTCEKDSQQAIAWLSDLCSVMRTSRGRVGCSSGEVQMLKQQQQKFQETARGAYEYGMGLLMAALVLRRSAGLAPDKNRHTAAMMGSVWSRLLAAIREQMTRLRVAAIFYRDIYQHEREISRLLNDESVTTWAENEKLTSSGHRTTKIIDPGQAADLLQNLGRTLRLGRLLQRKIMEPLLPGEGFDTCPENREAVQVIADKVNSVTSLAKKLDSVLGAKNSEFISHLDALEDSVFDMEDIDTELGMEESLSSGDEYMSYREDGRNTSKSSSISCYQSASECSCDWSRDVSPERVPCKDHHRFSLEQPLTVRPEALEQLDMKPMEDFRDYVNFTPSSWSRDSAGLDPAKEKLYHQQANSIGGLSPNSSEDSGFHNSLSVWSPETPPKPVRVAEDVASKEWLELRVVEMSPELTKMGDNLNQASDLLVHHEEVLAKLQCKQSPVEELLKQADQLIATQKPRAEVYAAMAESLGQAWKELNDFLEQRKSLLESNVSFHSHAAEVSDKLAALDRDSASGFLPMDVDSIKRLLARLEDSRRSALESTRVTLQQGENLLEKLRLLLNQGTLDSRPQQILPAVRSAISQVQRWLEALHDRRRQSELLFQKRKTVLEDCLLTAVLRKDLELLTNKLKTSHEELMKNTALGDSTATAEMLLFEHNKLQPECKELQEHALKLTRQAEELFEKKQEAAQEVRSEAYTLLEHCTDYMDSLEQRTQLLSQAINFFRVAQTATTKLDQLEVQLTAHQIPAGSPQLAQLHAQVSRALEDATAPALHHGYSLLDTVGRGHPGAEGVRRMVETLENRGIQLGSLCTAHKEESLRIAQAVRSFIEQYEIHYSWLLNIVEAFMKAQQDMGGTLPEAREILELHIQLLNDLNVKGTEIEALLRSVNRLCEMAEEPQAHEMQMKADHLNDTWQRLRRQLVERVDLQQNYVRVHSLAMQVSQALDDVENRVANEDADVKEVEELWLGFKQKFLQFNNTGRNFMSDSLKINDRYLNTRKACLCIEGLLEYFSSRQLTVHEMRETWITKITTIRESREEWTVFTSNMQKTTDRLGDIENQFFPILPTENISPSVMVATLETKLNRVLENGKNLSEEFDQRRKEAESMKSTGTDDKSKAITNILVWQQKLQLKLNEFKTCMQLSIAFFKNLTELDSVADALNNKRSAISKLGNAVDVDSALKDHAAGRETGEELLRFARNEADQLIIRLKQQEPAGVTNSDVEVINSSLTWRQNHWLTIWNDYNELLIKQKQKCQFNSDLHQINVQLDDLSRQLAAMKGQFGSSLATANSTSQAFLHFEKTIELLEKRIESFVSTAHKMINEDPRDRDYLVNELEQINRKWTSFHQQVGEKRKLINLSIEYFTIIEEVEDCFKEGSKLLVTIARKTAAVKSPTEAQTLLREMEVFLKPNETKQEERIRKLTQIAFQLYGPESTKHTESVLKENRNMIDSFNIINKELSTLTVNLKSAEEQKLQQIEAQIAFQESLEAAKAEAAAARAAAAAAEEARKAAEAVAVTLRETPVAPPRPPSPVDEIDTAPARPAPPQLVPEPPPRIKLHEIPPIMESPMFVSPLHDAVVEESKRFTFSCKVTGKPAPEVSWLKDGLSIDNNPDYLTSYNNGVCTLTIEETFTEDSARFTCQATNPAGYAQTSATLKVKEYKGDDELIPPEFTVPLEDSVAREGQPHQLQCTVIGHPLPAVSWFKNDKCVDHCPDYSISCNNGVCVLRFEEVFIEDQAEYVCKAFNVAGDADTSAILTVEPLEPTELPSFVEPLTNVMARTGQKVRLECSVAGIPFPAVIWMHNNKPVKETRDLKSFMDGTKAILTITEAFPKDAGLYTAIARNIAGEATSSCSLAVKGLLPTETSDSELASDMEPIKPTFQQSLRNVTVKEGEPVRLDCIIVGQPEPEVIWYHDERPVKESSDIQLLFQGDRCSLIISEAFLEDAGTYRVVAINSAGEASSSCSLTISPATDTPALAETKKEVLISKDVGEAPKFEKLLHDVQVVQYQPIYFEVKITGRPTPVVTWYKDNLLLSTNQEYYIVQRSDGVASLEIRSAQPYHAATYAVKAVNSAGEAKCLAAVKVAPPPPPPPVIELMDPPVFTKVLPNVFVRQGAPLELDCAVTGKPTPKVEWFFNGSPVSGGSAVVSSEGNEWKLRIASVQTHHGGKYSCVAENKAGKATSVASVTVEEPAISSVVPQTQLDSTTVSGSSFFTRKVTCSQSSTFFSSTEEGSKAVKNEVHHTVQETAGQPVEEVHTERLQHVEQKEDEVPSVKQIASMFAMKGGATTAAVQQSSQMKIVKNKRKSVPPKFVSPLVGVMVEQNARVCMEAIVDAFPEPDVKWYLNGTELSPSENIELLYSNSKATMIVKRAAESDSGRYTCTARNEAGTASSTADLVVRRTQFPPVFGRRLQAQTVRPGSRITMEVEVTGTPVPEVTWQKDDRPITDPRMTIKAEGTRHSLVIAKVNESDSGRYIVKASNRAGEAVSIAEMLVSPSFGYEETVTKTTVIKETPSPVTEEPKPVAEIAKTVQKVEEKLEYSVKKQSVETYSQVTEVKKSVTRHPALKLDVSVKADQLELTPEPPPEVGFAPKPETPGPKLREDVAQRARKLEEASKKLSPVDIPGAIRLLPKPSEENGKSSTPPDENAGEATNPANSKAENPVLTKFEPFPELEPFPFKPDPPRPKREKGAPPRNPSRFVKGESRESDYESDFEGRIAPRWVPPGSDTEDLTYQRVRPKLSYTKRAETPVAREPTPPTVFDSIPLVDGPPRPQVLSKTANSATEVSTIEARESSVIKQSSVTQITSRTESKVVSSTSTVQQKSDVKSESLVWPPITPKEKDLCKEANIPKEEKRPSGQLRPSAEALAMEKSWLPKRHEESTENTEIQVSKVTATSALPKPSPKALEMEKQWSHKFATTTSKIWPPPPPEEDKDRVVLPWTKPQRDTELHTEETTTSKHVTYQTEVRSSTRTVLEQTGSLQKENLKVLDDPKPNIPAEKPPKLEPFPFEPSKTEVKPKQKLPPPSKPSRFVKGEFRESDYESDYEGRIPPKWVPPESDNEELVYRKVKPKLDSVPKARSVTRETPPPPSSFDTPPQFEGHPRPVVELPTKPAVPEQVKEDPVGQKEEKIAQEIQISKPQPQKSMGLETTKRVQMEESTQFSKRFITVEQTTKYIQLGDSQAKMELVGPPFAIKEQLSEPLEPFPFVPDPPRPKTVRKTPPPPKPKRFVPGETRESDYESDYEGARIRPRWVPAGSDAEDPAYRTVQPPPSKSKGKQKTDARTPTPPTVFDNPPTFDGPPRPVITPTDIQLLKEATLLEDISQIQKLEQVKVIKPTPVKLPQQKTQDPGYVEQTAAAKVAQDKAATHFTHMSSAFRSKAHEFAEKVMADVSIPAKPVLEVSENEQKDKPLESVVPDPAAAPDVAADQKEPHAYHEESRVSEFGTKHIDPDTGLIYFKYDFGYEFGLVLPGESQKVEKIESSIGKDGSIELPVLHERTTPAAEKKDPETQERVPVVATAATTIPPAASAVAAANSEAAPKQVPHFKPKRFTQFKAAKWEPTTDSELSELDPELKKCGPSRYYESRKDHYAKFEPRRERSQSPQSLCSLSPRESFSLAAGKNVLERDPAAISTFGGTKKSPSPRKQGEH